ncbi:MAG: tetratricopeptide repeat protein [Bacteroidales bacterium]|nr:tetratricopeptide repeat protein [Bacteroidales bacterium]
MKRAVIQVFVMIICLSVCNSAFAFFNSDVKKAKKFMSAQMYPQAIELLNKRINEKPDDAEAHFQLGKCYLKIGNSGKAKNRFKSAVSLDKDYGKSIGEFFFKEGENILNNGNERLAEQFFDEAIFFNTSNKNSISTIYFNKMKDSLAKNNINSAKYCYSKIQSYDPLMANKANELIKKHENNMRIGFLKEQIQKLKTKPIIIAVKSDLYESNGKKMDEWQAGFNVIKENNGIIKEVSTLKDVMRADLIIWEAGGWGDEEILKNLDKLLSKGKVIWIGASDGTIVGANRNKRCRYDKKKGWVGCMSAPKFANQFLEKFGIYYTTRDIVDKYTDDDSVNFPIKMETGHPLCLGLDFLLGYRQPYIVLNNSNAKPIGHFKSKVAIALLEDKNSGGVLIIGGGSDYTLFLGIHNKETKKRDMRINAILGNMIKYTKMKKIRSAETELSRIESNQ